MCHPIFTNLDRFITYNNQLNSQFNIDQEFGIGRPLAIVLHPLEMILSFDIDDVEQEENVNVNLLPVDPVDLGGMTLPLTSGVGSLNQVAINDQAFGIENPIFYPFLAIDDVEQEENLNVNLLDLGGMMLPASGMGSLNQVAINEMEEEEEIERIAARAEARIAKKLKRLNRLLEINMNW